LAIVGNMAQKPPNMLPMAWKALLYSQGKIDRDQAIQWLNANWVARNRNCPVCSSANWGVEEDIVRLMTIKGPAYPSVAVICNVCGYTMLMNAIKMRLLPEGKER